MALSAMTVECGRFIYLYNVSAIKDLIQYIKALHGQNIVQLVCRPITTTKKEKYKKLQHTFMHLINALNG